MPGNITVGGQEAATNADILQGTRLQSAPAGGTLTFEIQASDNVAANNFTVSIQLPDGDTPMTNVPVPSGAVAGLAGVIDEREDLQATYPVGQGGHTVFSCIEVGDTEMTWRVTYRPAR